MHFVLYAPVMFERWNWENSVTKGIGGSETSTVEFAWRLVRRGHEVTVYAPLPEGSPNEWRGSKWLPLEAVDWSLPGCWILYRCPEAVDNFDQSRTDQVRILCCQDWDYRTWTPERIQGLDRIMVLCEAHRNWLARQQPAVADRLWISQNGLKCDLVEEVEAEGVPARNYKRIMYASSPDRGLKAALKIFKRAKEFVPDLEFYATYGFDNLDKLIARGAEHYRRDKDECLELIEQTGAKFLGRINQKALYKEWFKTACSVYCTTFWETSWISGAEMSAMGAIPIFSPIWAQSNNTQFGIGVPGDPNDPATIAKFAAEVVRLTTDPGLQDRIRAEMMPHTRKTRDWEQFVGDRPGQNWIQAAEEEFARKAARVSASAPPAPGFPHLCDNADEADCRRRWLKLKPGDVFVDVGAADGAWSVAAAEQGATCYAFEPNERTRLAGASAEARERWRAAMWEQLKGGKSPALLSFAASVAEMSPQELAGAKPVVPGNIFVERFYVTDRTGTGVKGQVGVALDTWAVRNLFDDDRIDFVKIDVEGMEMPALRGMQGVLARWRPRLMVEVHEETVPGVRVQVSDVTKFLDGLGLGYRYEPVARTYQGKRYTHLYCEVDDGE